MSVDDYRRFKSTGKTFAGTYNSSNAKQSSFASRYDNTAVSGIGGQRRGGGRSAYADNDDDEEDIEGLKQQIKQVKTETLESTRLALSKLKETEEIGENTLVKLGEQTDQIIHIEQQLDRTEIYADKAHDQTTELKKLNKSIFAISLRNPFSSKKNREAELAAVKDKYKKESDRIAQQGAAKYKSQQRVQGALQGQNGFRYQGDEDKSKYMYEDEDPELENEIDQNLDLMGDSLSRLKNIGMAMNEEVSNQNQHLDRMNDNIDRVGGKIAVNSKRLETIK